MIIGIDLGTTGARSIVYDGRLKPLGECYIEYPLLTPREGWVEQDASLWWSLTVRAVRGAVEKARVDGRAIRAIGISSQGISVVPVDEANVPLHNAISWLDRRGTERRDEILRRFDARWLFDHTGKLPNVAYTLPKLLWLRGHDPALFAKVHRFMLPHDFLTTMLTGVCATDHTLASGTMLYDLRHRNWSREICSAFEIDIAKLPELRWGGEAVGPLIAAAARALDLHEGVVVYAGGQDQKCASLAAGLEPGVATLSLGTSAAIECVSNAAAHPGIPRFAYFRPGEQILEGVVITAGLALRWLRDTLFPAHSYAQLDELAAGSVGVGQTLFLPYLTGEGSPGWDGAREACFHRLSLSTGRGELICALLEGVAFEVRRNLTAMEAEVFELRVFGGGARSAVWCALIAHITGLNVRRMDTPEAACLGAAILAARGAGYGDGVASAVQDGQTFAPDVALGAFYEEKYLEYRRIRDAIWR